MLKYYKHQLLQHLAQDFRDLFTNRLPGLVAT